MPIQTISQTCACRCGASRFVVAARPRVRYLCHCTICQAVCRRPFADITALRADDVRLAEGHRIQFKQYRKPPAVDRGICLECGCSVVDFMSPMPFVRLAFASTDCFPDQAIMPPPKMHIFYHRRVAEIDDALPKYSGPWRSQLAATPLIISVMFHRRGRA